MNTSKKTKTVKSTNTTNTNTKIALMAALQCIISPFAIVFPFSPVPISLATLMLYISAYILGKRNAVISCGIYLLIGLVGIPVFSGFTGGIGKVLGPTGGYLLGYLFLAWISGWFVEKWSSGKKSGALSGNYGKKSSVLDGNYDEKNSVLNGSKGDKRGAGDENVGSPKSSITNVNYGSRKGLHVYINYLMQGIGMALGTAVCYLFGSLWLAYQAGMSLEAALMAGVVPFIPGDVAKIVIGVLAGAAVKKRLVRARVA